MFLVIQAGAQRLGRYLLDLLYPPRCVGCGQIGTLYCERCLDSVSVVPLPCCSLCGQPQEVPGLCSQCAVRPLRIDGIRSLALFEGTLREAIHCFKYKYMRALAVPLGDMLVEFWSKSLFSVDVLVPVPLHRRRLRERGYNQAQLLAQHLGFAVDVPVVCDVLRRVRYTASQTRLGVHERRQNVADAFCCIDSSLQGKRVFLIDDVCTTGSTLEACSVALEAGGAASVWALTLARARGV